MKNFTNNMKWLRPCDIFKGEFMLFDGIDENDIKQGSLGVCYMLATISALARNPENIKSLHDLARDGLKLGIAHEEQSALGALTKRMMEKIDHDDRSAQGVDIAPIAVQPLRHIPLRCATGRRVNP